MFNTNFPVYPFFIIISLSLGLIDIIYRSKYLKLKKEEKIVLLVYILLGAVLGGKYFTFIVNLKKYDYIVSFSKLGLSSYGSVIGIILMIILYSKQFKRKIKDTLLMLMPSIPLMYGVGKMGCFLAGCCYGIEYNGVMSVIYNYSHNAPANVSLFPVQLLESIIFILIYLIICLIIKRNKNNYKIIGFTFILCGTMKFLLDFLRHKEVQQIFSINQIISILFIILSLMLIFNKKLNI